MTEWPESALTLLDSLWNTTTMAVIRKRMLERFGFYPTPDEVRAAANRFREGAPPRGKKSSPEVLAAVHTEWLDRIGGEPAPKPRVAEPEPVPTFAWRDPAPERPKDNMVRRVAPGSFPARGFTMLGKRT